jgi:hypothetical protein
MSASSLRLPNSLHERARELARSEGVSINQLVAAALAEKMSALLTEEYLGARAQRGSRTRFLAALAQVPAVEPAAEDALTPQAPGGRPQRPTARAKTVRRRAAPKRRRG